MKWSVSEMVDYRRFRWNKLNDPEFSHLRYLLFWPIFGVLFSIIERVWVRPVYHPVSCALDDWIPFCELFLVPYLFWFVYLIGMHIYILLFDTVAFCHMMRFIILTYSIALAIYVVFPNCQMLRPLEFERDNLLTQFMAAFYQFDTNTNVCPSIHVIGSAAVMFCAGHSRHLSTTGWRLFFVAVTVLIALSTVFLKQHSVVDVLAAVPVCVLGYWCVYGKSFARKSSRY